MKYYISYVWHLFHRIIKNLVKKPFKTRWSWWNDYPPKENHFFSMTFSVQLQIGNSWFFTKIVRYKKMIHIVLTIANQDTKKSPDYVYFVSLPLINWWYIKSDRNESMNILRQYLNSIRITVIHLLTKIDVPIIYTLIKTWINYNCINSIKQQINFNYL